MTSESKKEEELARRLGEVKIVKAGEKIATSTLEKAGGQERSSGGLGPRAEGTPPTMEELMSCDDAPPAFLLDSSKNKMFSGKSIIGKK